MKNIILWTFFVALCLLVEVKGSKQSFQNQCARVTHHSNGDITAVGCGTYECAEGKQIGYRHDDLSKPYPECCGGPICKD
ncbi:uncharacterized protein LOC143378981 [Andrena cerasifolii]|uniref:uncharacterized protein LOC143378981 n=1 Tax=Andrena cerasifolii TaxID=2819439 RepID=UPI0040379506